MRLGIAAIVVLLDDDGVAFARLQRDDARIGRTRNRRWWPVIDQQLSIHPQPPRAVYRVRERINLRKLRQHLSAPPARKVIVRDRRRRRAWRYARSPYHIHRRIHPRQQRIPRKHRRHRFRKRPLIPKLRPQPIARRRHIIRDQNTRRRWLPHRVSRIRRQRHDQRLARLNRRIRNRRHRNRRTIRRHRDHHRPRQRCIVGTRSRPAAHRVLHRQRRKPARPHHREPPRIQRGLRQRRRLRRHRHHIRRRQPRRHKRHIRLPAQPVAVRVLRVHPKLNLLPIIHPIPVAILLIDRDTVKSPRARGRERLDDGRPRAVQEPRRIAPPRRIGKVRIALHFIPLPDDGRPAHLQIPADEREVRHFNNIRRRPRVRARLRLIGIRLSIAIGIRRARESRSVKLHAPNSPDAFAVHAHHGARRSECGEECECRK